jgi:hypothetical protein
MNIAKALNSWARQRPPEVFHRAGHAISIFSKRFFTLSVAGHIELEDDFIFEQVKAKDRGYKAPNGICYSQAYDISPGDLPTSIKRTIQNYDSVLRMFLGEGYRINEGHVWRNYSIPDEYRKIELFSQHWHYDKVVDFRNVQLFILLGDVTDDDGPFEYVTNPDEHNILPSVLNRSNKDLGLTTCKFTGKRGDTLLFSTGSTPHRAGIPKEGRHRDIFSIAFFPAYTKIGLCSTELLCKHI